MAVNSNWEKINDVELGVLLPIVSLTSHQLSLKT